MTPRADGPEDHRGQPAHEVCTADCLASRQAAAIARYLLASDAPSSWWPLQVHALPSPPGELRLAVAGEYPTGRVPLAFRIAWWEALADAALGMAWELAEQDEPESRSTSPKAGQMEGC